MAQIFTATRDDEVVVLGTHGGRARVVGLKGESGDGPGVVGRSVSWIGVYGDTQSEKDGVGVWGENKGKGTGIVGKSAEWMGVYGESASLTGGAGVWGRNAGIGTGVIGTSTAWIGVYGETTSTLVGSAAIWGDNKGSGPGIVGKSIAWIGVYGETASTIGGAGIWGQSNSTSPGTVGKSTDGIGVLAASVSNEGLRAETSARHVAAIAAYHLNPEGLGAAIFGRKPGASGHAGFFEGRVHVTRDLRVEGKIQVDGDVELLGADCAEEFPLADARPAPPGSVMVIGRGGTLRRGRRAYDKKVAGVVSGGGRFRPALLLDRQKGPGRVPVALLGKVCCLADSRYAPIEVGDLLTTSPTLGHAMKADDPGRAFGAVLGKALAPLRNGRGLIPIIVALQ